MAKVKSCTYVLMLFLFLIGTQATSETYSRFIFKERLTVRAPRLEYIEGGVAANSLRPDLLQVRLNYSDQIFLANSALLRWNAVLLRQHFIAYFETSTLEGRELLYNFNNNHFFGKEVTLTSDWLQLEARRLSYDGNVIGMEGGKLSLRLFDIGIGFDGVSYYPGWGVINGIYLESLGRYLYIVPVWVVDNRRNAFQIPDPLPESGSNILRGNYWALNTHYYFNGMAYGFAHIGGSQYKGAMIGIGQILRLSDQDQFYLGSDWWQMTEPQIHFEYKHSFLTLPPRKARLTFEEMLDYNRRVKDLDASDVRVTYTKREDINDEEVDRDLEFGYTGRFSLTEKLGLDLDLASGHIYEYSSQLHGLRTNSDLHFYYDQPVWIVDPLRWGLGYTRSDYDLKPYTWQMVDGTAEWEREFWFLLFGIRYKHYFYEAGGSPFVFDQKYSVPNDNVLYNIRIGKRKYHIGVKYLQDVVLKELIDTTYYLGWTFSGWTLQASYSTQREAFAIGIVLELF